MQIKQFDKPGFIAWSNSKLHSELLASAGFQEDDGLYYLDILSLDLQERSKKLNVVGSGYSDSPFRCVAWDSYGQKQSTHSHGLIFTGMEDGSYKLWNPQEMIATYPNRDPPSIDNIDQEGIIIYQQEIDGGFPIMCGQWNGLKNNILAFGGTDVFILIIDKDPTNPNIRKPGNKNPHQGSYVTSVSWNRQVPQILASASENGLVALWDTMSNKSIFQFRDSGASTSGNRNVSICWSKSISTQIAVTLDDEKHNQLQIWDLRNQKGPVVVIDKHHTKGINAMDWCETDPELILTTSKDKKLACWNYTQEEEPLSHSVLSEQALGVKWSRKLPSIYSVSTAQKTYIYTLNDANLFSYVPKWYKIPVNVTILGNDTLLTYSQERGSILYESIIPDLNKKSQIRPKLKTLLQTIQLKNEDLQGDDLSALLKAKASDSQSEIYDYLGFNKAKIVQQVEKYTGKKRQLAVGHQKQKSVKQKPKAYTQIQGQDALAFFASINNQAFEQSSKLEEDDSNERVQYDMVPRNFNWDLGKEKLVKQNILIGNYESAIDAAIKCGRTAQALIIAYSISQGLFNNTLKTFFTQTTDSFITDVLKNIAYKDTLELVKKYDLNKWKQCIALIYSTSSKDKRPFLLKALAERLRTESEQSQLEKTGEIIPENYAAIIVLILAEDFVEITNIYSANLNLFASGSVKRKLTAVEYAKRLITIYENLTIQVNDLKIFQRIVREVAFIAIEQHQKLLAHHLFSTYLPQSSQKYIDYLINTTKELDKYKGSIKYKQIVLPIMNPKKTGKKEGGKQPQGQKQTKQKAKIFHPSQQQQQVKAPVPPPKKREQPLQEGGFSPYQNQRNNQETTAPTLPPKKNLNNPPPPPINQKKHVAVEEEQPEREVPTKPQPIKIQPPVSSAKKVPPPPPPPSVSQPTSHHQIPEEETPTPSVKSTKPPPPPIQKKSPPPPPTFQKPQPPPQRQEPVYEPEPQPPKQVRPPPGNPRVQTNIQKTLTPPPPPPPQQIPEQREETVTKRPVPPRIPQKIEEPSQQKQRLPPSSRAPQKKIEEPEPEQQPQPQQRHTPPPPPPPRRGPPPPPVRR